MMVQSRQWYKGKIQNAPFISREARKKGIPLQLYCDNIEGERVHNIVKEL